MNKLLAFFLLSALVVFSAYCHFSNLGWGLPSRGRSEQVFGTREEMEKWLPKMIEQRNQYYAGVDKMLSKSESLVESYNKLSHRWDVPQFEKIPPEIVLDRMRNYIIGVNVSDEQHTLNAISGLNPLKLDFTPGPLRHYGGFYYYSAAAFLVFGKVCGWLSLNSGAEYYFSHPEESRWMYVLVRSVGGTAVLLTLGVVFLLMKRHYGLIPALLSAAFFAVTPLMVPISHSCKAHLYGMFWISLGSLFCAKIVSLGAEKPSTGKFHWGAGICLGLSAGVIITNMVSGILLFFAECIRLEWKPLKIIFGRNFWISVVLFFFMFILTNSYLLTEYDQFLRLIEAMNLYFPAFTSLEVGKWAAYFRSFVTEQFHWTLMPLFAAGILASVRKKEKIMILFLLAFLVYFIQNLLIVRHAPVNVRLIPFVAVLSAWGLVSLLNSASGMKKFILAAYGFFAVLISGTQCYYYRTLFSSPTQVDLAGEWINRNVPENSTIGAWGGGFSPYDFPAIQFLRYQMVAVPHAHELELQNVRSEALPQFLVFRCNPSDGQFTFARNPVLRQHYQLLEKWPALTVLGGLASFKNPGWVDTGNGSVEILKLTSVDDSHIIKKVTNKT